METRTTVWHKQITLEMQRSDVSFPYIDGFEFACEITSSMYCRYRKVIRYIFFAGSPSSRAGKMVSHQHTVGIYDIGTKYHMYIWNNEIELVQSKSTRDSSFNRNRRTRGEFRVPVWNPCIHRGSLNTHNASCSSLTRGGVARIPKTT